MQISWHGLNCFTITTTTGSGEVTVVVDPYQSDVGLKVSRAMTADLVVVSHDGEDANNTEAVGGNPFIIDMPGEYEVKGVFVGAQAYNKEGEKKPHRILHIESEGISIAHLGDINRELTDKELETLSNVDILLLPVGGGRYLSPKMATEVLGAIEPRIVIPYAYDVDGIKETLESLDAFCKALGVCKREDVNKLKIARKNLPEEEMMIYVLAKD